MRFRIYLIDTVNLKCTIQLLKNFMHFFLLKCLLCKCHFAKCLSWIFRKLSHSRSCKLLSSNISYFSYGILESHKNKLSIWFKLFSFLFRNGFHLHTYGTRYSSASKTDFDICYSIFSFAIPIYFNESNFVKVVF